jgi:hypothetical protein
MPRRVQDIVPNERRSIRDISLDDKPRKKTRKEKEPEEISSVDEVDNSVATINDEEISEREIHLRKITIDTAPARKTRERNGEKRRPNVFIISASVILIIAVIGYFASSFYTKATFTITPKIIPVNINGDYVVRHAPSADTLSYELISVTDTQTLSVPASNIPQSSTKAKGKITVYNTFSSQPQRLIAGTRLASSKGYIYKTQSSVIIPGQIVTNGKSTPGKISVLVTADQPGQIYNISKNSSDTRLKIVAYKGSPKYDTIYADVTADISGGADSDKKIVDSKTLASSTAILQGKLVDMLTEKIQNSVPEGYIFFNTLKQTNYSSPSISNATSSSVALLSIQGTMSGVIMKKRDLITKLAGSKTVASFDNFEFDAVGLDKLAVNVANTKDFSATNKNTLIIHAKGDLKLVGIVPIDEIKSKLAGSSLSQTLSIFKPYGAVVDKASGELVPPWSRVPSNPDKITINVENK